MALSGETHQFVVYLDPPHPTASSMGAPPEPSAGKKYLVLKVVVKIIKK